MPDRHQQPSPFLDAAAVDAWDAWFRLREDGELRDLSIESTWQRVATALAGAEVATAKPWSRLFFEAQAQWRLVLDERVLAGAGSAAAVWPADPVAVLNLPAFVGGAFTAGAHVDDAALRDTAEIAVRCLDNVGLLNATGTAAPHVGVIGLADALAMLGDDYDSDRARCRASAVARTIAEGCLAASIRLARERGARMRPNDIVRQTWRRRDVPLHLVADADACGLRHAQLTSIQPQPRLAQFANNVTDALDPLGCEYGWRGRSSRARPGQPCGYAAAVARLVVNGESALRAVAPPADVPAAAQLALRASMQAWVDAPIDYPLCVPPALAVRAMHSGANR